MHTINRSAIVIRPAQPFLDWLHHVDSTSRHLTLVDLGLEPTNYLLPESNNEKQALEHLREVSAAIFEEELDGWYRDRSAWPEERDLSTLQRWFEFGFHSMVIDLSDDRIQYEEV
jgi:hypothetical protein